jgi:hypothetical protein
MSQDPDDKSGNKSGNKSDDEQVDTVRLEAEPVEYPVIGVDDAVEGANPDV